LLPRTAAGAPGASLEAGPANASEDAAHDRCVEHFVVPSQLLAIEVLRRPLEFTLGASILGHEPLRQTIAEVHGLAELVCRRRLKTEHSAPVEN
jgi:hypothetical protein